MDVDVGYSRRREGNVMTAVASYFWYLSLRIHQSEYEAVSIDNLH